MTYSIFPNTPIQSDRLASLLNILNQLPDNTTNDISPKDVRDAIFTTWENIAIKETTPTGTTFTYFGIDDNRELQFLFGKKSVGGTNVMSNLIGSDVDFYFYTNKQISQGNDLKIAFLAGSNTASFGNAPYFLVSTPSNIYDFSFLNLSGDTRISANNLYLNGLLFPPVGAAPNNGDYLVFSSGSLAFSTFPIQFWNLNGIDGNVRLSAPSPTASIIPITDGSGDLGSLTDRWDELYLRSAIKAPDSGIGNFDIEGYTSKITLDFVNSNNRGIYTESYNLGIIATNSISTQIGDFTSSNPVLTIGENATIETITYFNSLESNNVPTFTGVAFEEYKRYITATDNTTPTYSITVSTSTNTSTYFKAEVVAKKTTNSSAPFWGYYSTIDALLIYNSNTSTLNIEDLSITEKTNMPNANITLTASGGSVYILVSGEVGEDISWYIKASEQNIL